MHEHMIKPGVEGEVKAKIFVGDFHLLLGSFNKTSKIVVSFLITLLRVENSKGQSKKIWGQWKLFFEPSPSREIVDKLL